MGVLFVYAIAAAVGLAAGWAFPRRRATIAVAGLVVLTLFGVVLALNADESDEAPWELFAIVVGIAVGVWLLSVLLGSLARGRVPR